MKPNPDADAVYGYLRTLGDPGEWVWTAISPWLVETYGISASEAKAIRAQAMKELARRGLVVRPNPRSRWAKILA